MNTKHFIFVAAVTGIVSAITTLLPEKANVLEGENTMFTCLSDESVYKYSRWQNSAFNEFATVSWEKDRCGVCGFLGNTSRYLFYCNSSQTFSVLLKNVNSNRHGERWDCTIDFEFASASVYVIVPVKSVWTETKTNIVSANENSKVLLTCVSSFARPFPIITWYLVFGGDNDKVSFDGTRVYVNNSTNELFSTTSELVLQLNRNYNGHYLYCSASNHQGLSTESDKLLIDVKYPPLGSLEIEGYPNGSSYTIIENQQGTLACTSTGGNPLAVLTWNCFEGSSKTTKSNNSVTTEVTWIATRGHQNTCTCMSEHVLTTQDSVFVTVEILYMAKINDFYVEGTEGEGLVISTENETIQIICIIDRIATTVKLMFRWTILILETENTNNLTYTIGHVSCMNAGNYTCTGENTYNLGQPSIGHIKLLVKCPPRPLYNVSHAEPFIANIGDEVTFSIEIMAYPEPNRSNIVWMKHTNDMWVHINNSTHSIISMKGLQMNLTIRSVTEDDYGSYRLTVLNELGMYAHNFSLKQVKSEQQSDNNVAAIAAGSVASIVAIFGIVGISIYLMRKVSFNRGWPCMTKRKEGMQTMTTRNATSLQAVQITQEENSPEATNTYEVIQGNGDIDREYQQIEIVEGANTCIYKNLQILPSSTSS